MGNAIIGEASEQIKAREDYLKLATLSSLHKISIMSLRAAGVRRDASIVDVSSPCPTFLKHWRSSYHVGELIEIQRAVSAKRSLRGLADVVTANFATYQIPESEQPDAHAQIKRLLKPVTGIYAESTRATDNIQGIHADEVLVGQALEKVTGERVTMPQLIHYPYTIHSATVQLPNNFYNVYAYQQSSYIRITTSEEVDIKLACHRKARDLYVTSSGQTPTSEQHEEAIEIAIGDKIRLARAGIEPIIDYVEEALFLASDSPIDMTNFNHRFTAI